MVRQDQVRLDKADVVRSGMARSDLVRLGTTTQTWTVGASRDMAR